MSGYNTAMSTTPRTDGAGLVTVLLQDHGEARRMLDRFTTLPGPSRAQAFREIVRTLVAHESAEELVVYPALRQCAAGGAAIARDRITEQEEAERVLADLERGAVDGADFEAAFRKLRDAVVEHADAEERTAFWVLSTNLGDRELRRLAQRYLEAKGSAPTHAHPLAPDSPPANRVAGPLAGVMDRALDALHARRAGRVLSHRSGG